MNKNVKSGVVPVSGRFPALSLFPRGFAARALLTAGVCLLASSLAAQQNSPAASPAQAQGSPSAAGAPAAPPQPPPSRVAAETAARKLKVSAAGDFYIVSSIDPKAQQIVLKKPTEVTQLVQVDAQTKYIDENGQPLKLQGLRAGDTVFVVLEQKSTAVPIATSIRRGPMTVAILHQRYL